MAVGGRDEAARMGSAAAARASVTNERRIRDRMNGIADPSARAVARAEEAANAVADIAANRSIVRGSVRFVFQRAPQLVTDALGNATGIEVFVRVFRGANELHVDGHRRILNPPVLVPDGTTRQEVGLAGEIVTRNNMKEDPREALLKALEQSIAGTPNSGGWIA